MKQRWPLMMCGICGIIATAGFTAIGMARAVADEKALAAVSNRKTPSQKLEVLAHYQTMYWGTELQNRIAEHQHTLPKTFWALYHEGHNSTLYNIAQNEYAPVDLLTRLSEHNDAAVSSAAKDTLHQLSSSDR